MRFRTGSAQRWKYAYASVVGTSHTKTDTECQDSSLCTVHRLPNRSEVLIAAVADGAGSAQMASVASAMTAQSFTESVKNFLSAGNGIEAISREFVVKWLTSLQVAIIKRAEENETDIRNFASTLLGAIIGDESAVFVQLGDGALVVSMRNRIEEYGWIFWPQQGQYANQTYFVTDETAADFINHLYINDAIDDLAVFSDGLQSIALHTQSKTAHAPFFRAMFKPLLDQPSGYLEGLSATLGKYLGSDAVNQRTDDDKTLILATRRSQT